MQTATSLTGFDRVIDPILGCLTHEVAQRIVDLKVDAQLQTRLDYLADRANEGLLSGSEREEYEQYVEAIDLAAIIRLKAKLLLKNSC